MLRQGTLNVCDSRLLVQDELKCDNAADVWWFLHTPAEISISESGSTATLAQNQQHFTATILSPSNAKFTSMPAAPLPTSPHPEKQNENRGVRKLAIHLTDAREARIAVLFAPAAAAETEVRPLERW